MSYLPVEIWALILGQVPQKEWLALRRVCRTWYGVVATLPFHLGAEDSAHCLQIFRVTSMVLRPGLEMLELPTGLTYLDCQGWSMDLPTTLRELCNVPIECAVGHLQELTFLSYLDDDDDMEVCSDWSLLTNLRFLDFPYAFTEEAFEPQDEQLMRLTNLEVLYNVPASISAVSLSRLTKLRELDLSSASENVGEAFSSLTITKLMDAECSYISQEQLLCLTRLQILSGVVYSLSNGKRALEKLPESLQEWNIFNPQIPGVPFSRIQQLRSFCGRTDVRQYESWESFWKKST